MNGAPQSYVAGDICQYFSLSVIIPLFSVEIAPVSDKRKPV